MNVLLDICVYLDLEYVFTFSFTYINISVVLTYSLFLYSFNPFKNIWSLMYIEQYKISATSTLPHQLYALEYLTVSMRPM